VIGHSSLQSRHQHIPDGVRPEHRIPQQPQLIGGPAICRLLGVSRWTWHRWVRSEMAPQPVAGLPGYPRWRVSDIDRFVGSPFVASSRHGKSVGAAERIGKSRIRTKGGF
jgi:predicted DNA-binding transcriptional regulator AlpA